MVNKLKNINSECFHKDVFKEITLRIGRLSKSAVPHECRWAGMGEFERTNSILNFIFRKIFKIEMLEEIEIWILAIIT